MAQHKSSDIRAKTPDELDTMLLDLRKEQFNLRFRGAVEGQQSVSRIREMRRDIARIKTIQAEKRSAAAK